MAKKRFAESAVSVNTDTPTEMSFAVSDILQINSPHGQDSTVYIIDVNGTLVRITSRSASAKDKM